MKKNNFAQQNKEIWAIEDNLHDLVNWLHSGVVLPLEAVDSWLKQCNYEKISELLPNVILQSHDILAELRNIQTNILQERRNEVENFSIAINELVNIWLIRAGLQNSRNVRVNCPNILDSSELIKNALISMADEAISNAIKHSGIITNPETSISVSLRVTEKHIVLAIKDNGKGSDKVVDGYGVKKIKRIISTLKLAKIDTKLKIITSPDNGFTTRIEIVL